MKTLILILCVGLMFEGCKKGNQLPYQATLIGYNPRMCPTLACGGLMINIENDTLKNPSYRLINKTLLQLGIPESTKFPINIRLNWKPDTGLFGSFHYIIVSQITVVK
jgi:hypothetical protein